MNALFTLKNYGSYNNRFFSGSFSASRLFPAAFWLMLKIFSLVAKFSGLGVLDKVQGESEIIYHIQ